MSIPAIKVKGLTMFGINSSVFGKKAAAINMQHRFHDIIQLIKHSRENALKLVNTALIDLYWNIGQYLSGKIAASEWGDSVVAELARYIQQNEPELKGFSDKNLWRMKQFYEAYKDEPKLSTLLREISWSNNMAIFSRCKTVEEREFYLQLAKVEYALSRNLSPALVAEYKTQLPDKKLLQQKLHELFEQNTEG